MTTFTQNDPLTDAELDRLGDFLESCKGGGAMNVEQLDGFFAALVAGSETVMPSEYYSEVFGGEMSEACEFSNLDEANEILGLMMVARVPALMCRLAGPWQDSQATFFTWPCSSFSARCACVAS